MLFHLALQRCVSVYAGAIEAALEVCGRVGEASSYSYVTPEEVASLVSAISSNPSSPAVAQAFCAAVASICGAGGCADVNRSLCTSAGAIPAVIAALGAHGFLAGVASKGLEALDNLATSSKRNADAILTGALDVMLQAMESFSADGAVQEAGCISLHDLAIYASRSLMVSKLREERVTDVLNAAVAAHPGNDRVQQMGELALQAILAEDSDDD